MTAFALTPRARQDLHDIWDHIAADSVAAADRVLADLERSMRRLAKDPGIGHWREALADKRHRFFPVHSYLIVYRHSARPFQIVRILHASRDVRTILRLI